MQPEAQTTTLVRDSDRYSRRLRSVISLPFLHLSLTRFTCDNNTINRYHAQALKQKIR